MTSSAGSLYVGAAQVGISDSVTHNVRQITAAMARAAARGLELLVLPEAAVTGYSPSIGRGRQRDEWPSIVEGLSLVATKCAELGLWVAVGSEAWTGEAWANRTYVYSDLGELAATYDKVHLTRSDHDYYVPGARATVFDLRGVKVVLQGFYGAGGDTWKVPVLSAHLRSRAAENGCFVVACNVAGPLQIVASQIVDPLGLILAQANQDREEIISAEVDLSLVDASEIRQEYLRRRGARG